MFAHHPDQALEVGPEDEGPESQGAAPMRVPRALMIAGGGRARPAAPGKAMVTDRLSRARDAHCRKALQRLCAAWPEGQISILAVSASAGTCDVSMRRAGDRVELTLVGSGAATLATAPGWPAIAPNAAIEVTSATQATIAVALVELPLEVLVQLERLELARAFGLAGERDPVLATARELIQKLGLGAVEVYRGELGRARARAAGARGVISSSRRADCSTTSSCSCAGPCLSSRRRRRSTNASAARSSTTAKTAAAIPPSLGLATPPAGSARPTRISSTWCSISSPGSRGVS
jgi:hypothetical protein